MPKVTDKRLTRVHIQVFEEDWNDLLLFFGGSVKRSAAVRALLHSFVRQTKEKAQAKQVARSTEQVDATTVEEIN